MISASALCLSTCSAGAATVDIEADEFLQVTEPGGDVFGSIFASISGPDRNLNGVLDVDEVATARVTGNFADRIFNLATQSGDSALFTPSLGTDPIFPADDGFRIGITSLDTDALVLLVLTRNRIGVVVQTDDGRPFAGLSPASLASSQVAAVNLPTSMGFMIIAFGLLAAAGGLIRPRTFSRTSAALPVRLRARLRNQRTVLR